MVWSTFLLRFSKREFEQPQKPYVLFIQPHNILLSLPNRVKLCVDL